MSTAAPVAIKPKRVRKPKAAKTASPTLEHVHETEETVALIEMTPPHPPRVDTPEYEQTHRLLVFDKDTGCKVCKVRHSDLQDPARAKDPAINKAGATAIETHHYPVERSLIDSVDWRKVHEDFPAVYSQASLVMWVDSPENMLVLCDKHHRAPEMGIHHLLTQDFAIQPYLLDGYRVAATTKDAAQAESADEQIEQQTGIEQAVDAQAATAPAATAAPAAMAAKPARKPRAPRKPKAA